MHPASMVSGFLIAAALIAAPQPAASGSGARAVAVATATITHAVVIQGGTATTRDVDTAARPLPPRRCDPDGSRPDCHLIVLDLP
jgi:hypothetical protein